MPAQRDLESAVDEVPHKHATVGSTRDHVSSIRRNAWIRPLRTTTVTARLEGTHHLGPTAPQVNKLERVVTAASDELAAVCRHHRHRCHMLRMSANLHGITRGPGLLPEIPNPRGAVVVTTDNHCCAFAICY